MLQDGGLASWSLQVPLGNSLIPAELISMGSTGGTEGAERMTHGSCILPQVLAALGAPWSCTAHLPPPGDMLLTPAPTLLPGHVPSPADPLHPVPQPRPLPSSSRTDGVLVAYAVPWRRTTLHCVA